MPEGFRVVNHFLHDLATGVWLALVLVEAALRRTLAASGLLDAGRPVLALAFRWGVAALALILLTGVARTATYRDPGDVDPAVKRRLLWVKHVFLILVFGLGTFYAHRVAFA